MIFGVGGKRVGGMSFISPGFKKPVEQKRAHSLTLISHAFTSGCSRYRRTLLHIPTPMFVLMLMEELAQVKVVVKVEQMSSN